MSAPAAGTKEKVIGQRSRGSVLTLVPPLVDPGLAMIRDSPGFGWRVLMLDEGSQSQTAWRYAALGHRGERDRSGLPHLGHVMDVASYAVEDARNNGPTWQAIQAALEVPSGTSPYILTHGAIASRNPIDLSGLTVDETCAALLLHDWIESDWDDFVKGWQKRETDRPSQRPDVYVMREFLAEQLYRLHEAGMSDRVLYIVDGLTYLRHGDEDRNGSLDGQTEKLRHPLLANSKRYDFRHNLQPNRLYPNQPALDTVNQIWKYKLACDKLGVVPDGMESWDDLPRAVLDLPYVRDIIDGNYDMSVAPKDDPVIEAVLTADSFSVVQGRSLVG